MNDQVFNPKTQELLDLFSEAKNDSSKLNALIKSPIETLESLGITVDPIFHDAVIQGLNSLSYSDQRHNLEPTIHTMDPSAGGSSILRRTKPNDLEKYIHVSAELWGIVVKIDHQAVAELPKGTKAIEPLAEAIGAIMAASAGLGPAAVIALLGLAYWGAILTAYVLLLPVLDKGKGVYLTVTWPQIASGVASGGMLAIAMMPIPTTVV